MNLVQIDSELGHSSGMAAQLHYFLDGGNQNFLVSEYYEFPTLKKVEKELNGKVDGK